MESNKINSKALAGSVIGTAIPMAFMLKKQKAVNPIKLEYGLKDMLILSASSIVGGVAFGSINEEKETREKKVKEGVFQFVNAATPAIFAANAIKICEKYKSLNNAPIKILATLSSIALGMFAGAKLTNKFFDPKDECPDRKLEPKDCIASADDAISALALAKFPIIQTLHLDKFLPVAYSYCGYRAGKTN